MDIYTVSFFGHREVSNPFEVEKQLKKIIKRLIEEKEYVDFLVGRDGEYDQLVSSTIRRVVKEYSYGNTSLILVLPYMKAEYRDNEQNFLDYYNEVEICEESSQAYFKAAIQIRNRSMIDRSDLVVCYIRRKSGGVYKTIQYAEKQNKHIINTANSD